MAGELQGIPEVKVVRGKGLMIGAEFDFPIAALRKRLLFEYRIFTGSAGNKNTLRLLPSLAVTQVELHQFIEALKKELSLIHTAL